MNLRTLSLEHIRKHTAISLTFAKNSTVIIGDNASGKTTIAEAIQLLSTGESFRANTIDEIISFEKELGRVVGEVIHQEETTKLEILLTRGLVQNKKTQKRLFSINGVRRRKKDFVGKLKSVIFKPEDMRLIEGSPSRRRSFLDMPLSIVSYQYAHALETYEQTLVRRNKLLQQVREGEQPRTTLHFWNQSLLKHGELLQKERLNMLQTFVLLEFPVLFSVTYIPSIISEERQKEYLEREIASGRTLIGPHKDDFEVILHQWRGTDTHVFAEKDQQFSVAVYGSRGQQRLAVLWLKLCELQFIEQMHQEKPVLVLDDILSELDEESKTVVTTLLKSYQTIVTTTQTIDVELLRQVVGPNQLDIIEF